jgi:hypothetical protein
VPESREAQVLGRLLGLKDVSCWMEKSALDNDRGVKMTRTVTETVTVTGGEGSTDLWTGRVFRREKRREDGGRRGWIRARVVVVVIIPSS